MNVWSGCACALDGYVEEVHTYKEAEREDFHHSLYFSPEAAERISNGESVFFWIDDGKVQTEWRNGESIIVDKIIQCLKKNNYI